MGIRFTCEQCSNELEVPEASVGKQAKCPACACLMQVPEPQTENQSERWQNPDDAASRDRPKSQKFTQVETAQTGQSVVGNPLGLDDRTLATLAHASGLIGMLTVGILGFLGPLAIYLMYQDKSEFVARQAKEALNFQISLLLLSVAIVMLTLLSCGVTLPLVFVAPVMQLIFGIIAPLQVWSGKNYRYPLTLRLVK
ncbi:MAG: DUF4870 domain-containing protein [Planctomycetaceae bacterium]|nr:DUF4870 domain-containing protein [Planctomycetaceae bacterium]